MPVANIPSNSSSPSLFKIVPKISLCICVIFVIPIVVIYFSEKLILYFLISIVNFLIGNNLLKNPYFIVMIFPTMNIILLSSISVFYLTQVRHILNRLNFGLRDDWMNYISSKGSKMAFYQLITFFKPKSSIFTSSYYLESKFIDRIFISGYKVSMLIVILGVCFLLSFLYSSFTGIPFFGNIWESQNILNYLNTITTSLQSLLPFFVYACEAILMTLYFVMVFLTFIEALPMFIAICLFPVNGGVVDVSDIPVYFITEAIHQLEAVDFSESSEHIPSKKNKISNLVNDSLEFVKIDKSKQYPDYMNFCYKKCNGLFSEHAINDIRFRANGLYGKMNKILIKINHMSNLEDKNEIMKDLEMYLQIIETKDLSKIEAVEFVNTESTFDKISSFFFYNVLFPFFR